MTTYYTTEGLADAFPAIFSESSLKKSRMTCSETEGPPFKRKGRKVFYVHDEVVRWIESLNASHAPFVAMHKAKVAPGVGRPTKEQQIARRASAG